MDIGQRTTNSFYLNGSMANVQIYSTALSANQVQTLYQGGISGPPVTSSGLAGWWPLNGNSNDYSGNGNNGTATNVIYSPQRVASPYLLTSLNSYGANFNGQASAISLPANAEVTGNQITEVVWADQLGPNPSGIMLSQYGAYLRACENAYIPGTGTLFAVVTGSQVLVMGGTCPAYGVWNQYVGTYDGSMGRLYVNGVQVASNAISGNLASPGPSFIGAYAASYYYNFNGMISDVQSYNKALTSQQVQQLYWSQMPPSASASVPLGWVP